MKTGAEKVVFSCTEVTVPTNGSCYEVETDLKIFGQAEDLIVHIAARLVGAEMIDQNEHKIGFNDAKALIKNDPKALKAYSDKTVFGEKAALVAEKTARKVTKLVRKEASKKVSGGQQLVYFDDVSLAEYPDQTDLYFAVSKVN
jgi:hypothetical protein